MNKTNAISELIKKYDAITIWGHALPDGDCYGCQIGLREIIRDSFPEKMVYAVGSGIPTLFQRLSPMDVVDEKTISESLAIIVDVSCLRRVEDQRVNKAAAFAKFDHHMFNPGEAFEHTSFVDADRVSCAEIIAEWAFENNLKVSRLAAEALYLGIATDSGQFKYFGTTPKTFETSGKLFALGVEPYTLMDLVYKEDASSVNFRSFLVKHARLDGNVVYCEIGPKDYLDNQISYERASGMVNSLSVFNSPVYALFAENGDGIIRVELRSNQGYPVQPTAMQFGGGGHLFAAGCTLYTGRGPKAIEVVKACNRIQKSEG